MSTQTIVVDPHFRRMSEILSPRDLERLYRVGEIVWGRDEPMPLDEARAALAEATAIVCADWRYGDALQGARNLRAILTVSGAFPLALDYEWCFARRIRVLSAAPAFGPQVAEMALGLALAASRDIAPATMRCGMGLSGGCMPAMKGLSCSMASGSDSSDSEAWPNRCGRCWPPSAARSRCTTRG